MLERSPIHHVDTPPTYYDAGEPRDIRDHCGIAGIIGPDVEFAGDDAYKMAQALQHRGQESSGIILTNGEWFYPHKRMGLVAKAYDNGKQLFGIPGDGVIVQNRYGTSTVGSAEDHMQPVYDEDRQFSLVHNGNLPTTEKIDRFLAENGIPYDHLNDTERFHAGMAYFVRNGASLEDAMARMLPLAEGAASFIAMDRTKIVAAREAHGIRPLALGKKGKNVVFASETHALDEINATYLREVRPGEMIVADRRGIGSIQSYQVMEGENKLDLFEMVYFAHPESFLYGRKVREIREAMGRELFREAPRIEADLVVSAPDSATPAAVGYALAHQEAFRKEGKVPLLYFDPEAVRKNPDAVRTFIHPDPIQRIQMIREKFILDPDKINGKRLILVEDSIVRSSTAVVLIDMLREAGASEVHMMVHSPPIRWPELHGVDLPDQEALIAYARSVEQIRQIIKANSLTYLSKEGVFRAIEGKEDYFSTGPFTGQYPTDIGRRIIDRTLYDFYEPLHAAA